MAKPRLLVADDSPLDRNLLLAYITSLGGTAVMTQNGIEATDLAFAEQFDGLVLDYDMPGRTGLQTLMRIRRTVGPNRQTPALVWTAHEPYRIARAAHGIDDVVIVGRPLSRRDFADWMNRTIRQGARQRTRRCG